MILSHRAHERAFSIIETTIAADISAMFLGSLFSMNSSSMQTFKMAHESACASQLLQQRVEALRIANWHQITSDANYLKNPIYPLPLQPQSTTFTHQLDADAPGSSTLKSVSEEVTLVPYGSSTTGNIKLTRANGVTTIVSNQSLLTESAVKVIWTVTYAGSPNDHVISRQAVAVLAKGGVAKW